MNGWICWEDDHNMGCEFPFKVRVPGLKTEPIYSGDGKLIQNGLENPDRYGRLFVKSEDLINMEKSLMHIDNANFKTGNPDVLKEGFADLLVQKCSFSEDGSDYTDSAPLLSVVMEINGKNVFLYHNYVTRGVMSDKDSREQVDMVLLPFSTEPEVCLDSRLDDDRESALKDLYNWDYYAVSYDGSGKPYLNI